MISPNNPPFIFYCSDDDFIRAKNVLESFGFVLHPAMKEASSMDGNVAISHFGRNIRMGRISQFRVIEIQEDNIFINVHKSLNHWLESNINSYFEDSV